MDKVQITKIRNENEDITVNLTENKRTIKEHYEQLYNNKLDNLNDKYKFLKMFPILTEGKENLNTPMTRESTIKIPQTRKTPRPRDFISEFYEAFSK